ncbi:MAG: FAD-binding domain-containing protein [Candidatus Aenigmatarchaeota archaeon]
MRSVCLLDKNLRIEDSFLISEALRLSSEIYLIVIIESNDKDFRNWFAFQAAESLKKVVPLTVMYGQFEHLIDYLTEILKPDAFFTLKRFDWSGEKRSAQIRSLCRRKKVKLYEVFDNFLADITEIPLHKRFSGFFKEWQSRIKTEKIQIDLTALKKVACIFPQNVSSSDEFAILKRQFKNKPFLNLETFLKRFENYNFSSYEVLRDRLDADGTSRLSPLINFGVVSIREVFMKAGANTAFLRQLAWREYFYHLKQHFPEMNKIEINEKRRNIPWNRQKTAIERFKNAETGYPIVDAAVRQLLQEKWLPNRARMIVASFLVKDLLVDWREGERFFAENLLDYDEVLNVGNWQWVASVGPDTIPFRVFNPVLQAKKFDPHAFYIKKYLPELRALSSEVLQDPLKHAISCYLEPIVDHKMAVKSTKQAYFKNWN